MITARPISIRSAQIISSSVPYPDTGETLWAVGADLAVGDTRAYYIAADDLYHKFECKTAHTAAVGKEPQAYPDDETNEWWIDLGAVNKFAPFQLDRNTQNDAVSPYVVSVTPGERFTALAISNTIADDVKLEVLDADNNVVSSETKQLLVRDVYSWYDWLYAEHRQIKKTLFTDLSPISTNKLKLTFTRASGNVRAGLIIPGVSHDIGEAKYQAKITWENFSTFNRSFDAEVKLKVRRNVPSNNIQLLQDKDQVDRIKNLINDLNGEVTFWAGIVETTDGYFDSLLTIGLYKKYDFSIDYPLAATANIEIQEL